MEKKDYIQSVFSKFINGTHTSVELDALIQYFKVSDEQELRALIDGELLLPEDVSAATEKEQAILNRIDSKIWAQIQDTRPPERKSLLRRLAPYRAVAAAIVLICAVGTYFWINPYGDDTPVPEDQWVHDIQPGGNCATITLADGRTVPLSENKESIIITSDKIAYNDGGIISSGASNVATALNTIRTPRGGQYQVVLSDGTKVWLNAASSLTYPASFNGAERRVELQGEGYFEVAKNEKQPFIVTSQGQEVEVLGTHFNINSYEDEGTTRTTLLEGSVQVSTIAISTAGETDVRNGKHHTVTLSPNQQSVITPGADQIVVHIIDPEATIAWKNGDFVFKDEALVSIMRKISRWYDVEIVYEKDAPMDISLGGLVSKYQNVSDVLKVMELTGKVHFKIDGRRIVVMK